METFNPNINKKSALRFRRWSRTNYAVFVSLRVCVTIGFLADSIVDKSVTKPQHYFTAIFASISENEDIEKNISLEFEIITEQIQQILINNTTSDYTTVCGLHFLKS